MLLRCLVMLLYGLLGYPGAPLLVAGAYLLPTLLKSAPGLVMLHHAR